MHERKDAGQDRCRRGEIEERSDARQEGSRKECWDKGWRDVGEEDVGRKEQERRDAGEEKCMNERRRKGGIQE